MNKISVVIPTWNEEGNVALLIERLCKALKTKKITYELIFVDDHSTDRTVHIIKSFIQRYPISLYMKEGTKGKAQSLLEGFSHAKYDLLCMIDADLQYPPEAVSGMIEKINKGADVVVTNREDAKTSLKRKLASTAFLFVFGKILHGFNYDVQSGLKVFKKEIIERITLNPSPWSFDLEFLTKSRNAGYTIETHNITFAKRYTGNAKISLFKAAYEAGIAAIKLRFAGPEIIPFHPKAVKTKGDGFHYKGAPFVSHTKLHHSQTALYRMSSMQIIILSLFGYLLLCAFLINWHATLVWILAFLTTAYFIDLFFNLFLIYRSFSKNPEIQVTTEELTQLSSDELPMYTIFCPLYKEWEVLPQFVTAMNRLDYPKNKLQVILLLEEDDTETVEKARAYNLPKHFEILVVPHSKPKTKPKAMNYGLKFTRGEYVTIYDAEDVPEVTQLKKAIIAFRKSDKYTVCIQAKLNFYNPHQNILTRAFTAEYSLWFDLVLTGLQSINAPIPLGGTSNHFKAEKLRELNGWDAFNVTEDCDLGMRLVKNGYKTAIVDSTTYEEANSDYENWFWQRSRWIKGYMQTYLVHMRNPMSFLTNWKKPHFFSFQIIVGGKIFSMLINPLMWIITFMYFAFRAHVGLFIESFFPAPVLYMGVFCLFAGNFLYMYYYMIGCANRGYDDVIKYVYLVPLYWLAMSAAAWVAIYKLIQQPHFWSKTKHGLHLNNQNAMDQASTVIGTELVNQELTVSALPAF